MKDGSGVQSLDRAFDILELLSQARGGASLTEIAGRLGLHTSTAYRLLQALRARGYAEQTASRGVYRLGLELVRLCGQYLNSLELKTEAEPYLRQLSQATGQTVFLSTLQGGEVVYIDKVEQFNSLRKYSIIGQRRPLHCTSLGKALLLGMSEPEIVGFYGGRALEKRTPSTVGSVADLIEDLRRCRRRGWTHDDQEYTLGEQCVGAPIYDYREKVIAAVSASWSMKTSPDAAADAVAGFVMEAAAEISRRMGSRTPPPHMERG
jgi:DNA-binding IclR family transcriptional regulator